jgi:hypothetical protein
LTEVKAAAEDRTKGARMRQCFMIACGSADG